jgi:hypothetical protein
MNAWLAEQGYTHRSRWPSGAQLARIEYGGDIVLPYIDGGESHCTDRGDYLLIDSEGELDGCNTTGYAEAAERTYCDACNEAYDADNEGGWVGAYEDTRVCHYCFSDHTEVIGRRGNTYHVHQDDAVLCETDDQYYDSNYLDYNDVVYVDSANGYYKTDDCTQLTDTGDWILTENRTDDEYVCLDYDSDSYALRDNCWQCAGSDEWYLTSDHTPVIGADGKQYHEDDLPEPEHQAYNARRVLVMDAVNYAESVGTPLHCHHVTQYIGNTW